MKTYVYKSPINGLGLFARIDIKIGSEVTQFKGFETDSWSEHLIELNDKYIELTNESKYVNHSSYPNTIVIGDKLIAIKMIHEDDEITFDYECGDESFKL